MNQTRILKLTMCGGVGSATGANFLLQSEKLNILIDCGLEQGSKNASAFNREQFPYDPASIDILLITHAHTDHIGRIPKLVKEGFKGIIYSTAATHDLAEVMLPDTLHILEEEAKREGILPLYERKDLEKSFLLWKNLPYHIPHELGDGLSVVLKDSGHILGSVMYEISCNGKKIVFTGDVGNSPSLFLRDTESITDATYILMESVYGDRNHESKDERKESFTEVIRDIDQRKATLIIPAFSLERTQDILFELNDLIDHKKIGADIHVFIDSPLATKITRIYKQYTNLFKESATVLVAEGDDLFNFPNLKFTMHRPESEKIDYSANPKIIMAGSGMSNGGRILNHEKKFLPDPTATLLFMGYQAPGTLGRVILDGAKKVMIDGEEVKIRANIKSIMGYSSHKDSDHLINMVAETESTVKKVFVTMGEPKSSMFLVQRLRDYLGVNAIYPKLRETVDLEF